MPNRIQINGGGLIESPAKEQTLGSGRNTIKMIWDSKLATCKEMFKDLKDIISIDLTNFNFNLFNDMEGFFFVCDSLMSIDLSGADATNDEIYVQKLC